MAFIAKASLGMISVATSACAISLPLTMKSGNTTHSRGKRDVESEELDYQFNNESTQLKLANVQDHSLDTQEEEEDQFLSFDELGRKIETHYVDAQEDEGQASSDSKLGGGEKLKEIIQPDAGGVKQGRTKSEDGKLCNNLNNTQSIFCGYLEFENNTEDNSYKVKIDLKNSEGQVTVAKPTTDEYIETFNQDTGKGERNDNIDFDSLSTFNRENSTGGESVTKISFKFNK